MIVDRQGSDPDVGRCGAADSPAQWAASTNTYSDALCLALHAISAQCMLLVIDGQVGEGVPKDRSGQVAGSSVELIRPGAPRVPWRRSSSQRLPWGRAGPA